MHSIEFEESTFSVETNKLKRVEGKRKEMMLENSETIPSINRCHPLLRSSEAKLVLDA